MGRGAWISLLLVGALLGGCDRGEPAPPAPPTVPDTIPPAEQVETCAELVDPALGLLQGQLDAVAGTDVDDLLDPQAPLPAALGDLEPATAELTARADERCAEGELEGLLAARLGELRATSTAARHYLDVLRSRLGGG